MKYLSVCSGIEAASVAWEPLGWEAVGFSEIEPFPCAVLAHHYPHVPLHGDFTALIEDPPSCDVLVGGTPCQAFSVAGARRSLDDARGNLSLAYVELANAIDRKNHAEGQEPCITVWENVPGVFSTKDNAFGCFLRGLAGGVSSEDGPLEPPGGRWTHCGAVLGPQRAVAWRVLDAQYFGLAQRRQRVFVVASARNGFDPTQILLEWEGVRRDSAPSRPTRENPAAASGVSPAPRGGEHAGRGDGRVETPCPDPAGPIGGAGQSGGFRTTDLDNNGSYIVGSFPWPQEVADPLTSNEAKTYTHEGTTFRTRNVVPHVVSESAPLGFSVKDYGADAQENIAPTLRAMNHTDSHANGGGQLGVVMPEPQGFYTSDGRFEGIPPAGLWTSLAYDMQNDSLSTQAFSTLQAEGQSKNNRGAGVLSVQAPFVFDTTQVTSPVNYSSPKPGDPSHPLAAAGHPPTLAASAGQRMVVRRLTPRECERLQGFPDDWTLIPWKGKPAVDCPDGPRYKALGNSMAVPVMRWIGRRIDAHTSPHPTPPGKTHD